MQTKIDQISTGIRGLLSWPVPYRLFQSLVGARKSQSIIVKDFFPILRDGTRVLDIGCGDAEILDFLPENIDYIGFDFNEKYIQFAQEKYGKRAHFFCKRVDEFEDESLGKFDLVLAVGILHHLNNSEAMALFKIAKSKLINGGTLVTVDPTYIPNQSLISRFIISKDRGQHVRHSAEYMSLATSTFPNVVGAIRSDLLHIPYSHFLMTCIKE